MRLLVIAAWALAACATAAPAPTATPSVPATPDLASFDHVWQTIKDRHWDPASLEPRWSEARARLRPRVAAAPDTAAAREVMRELLREVGLSHYAIAPPGPERVSCSVGDLGLEWRKLDGRPTVVRVHPQRPAAQAGVALGWALVGADEPPTPCLGQPLALRFDTPSGERVVTLVPTPSVEPLAKLGNLPAFPVRYRASTLGDVGYVELNVFLDPARVVPAFEADLLRWADTRGVVLDLRGNPGGLGAMAMGLGRHFVEGTTHVLGAMRTRESTLSFVLNGSTRPYRGRLAILVDGESASTTEILAQGLKDLGRARVFGERTAGQALPSVIERLPNGDLFQYAMAHYVSVGGVAIEGHGVVPDVAAPWSRAELAAGRDAALEAALAWIREVER